MENWNDFLGYMVSTYATNSSLNTNDDDEEDMWVECPECGEPILEEDYSFEEVRHRCPICEYEWE